MSRWVAEDALLARVGFRGAEAAKGYLLVRAITITRSGATPWMAYNLTVANHHTFFVGKSRAWVHNECDWDEIPWDRLAKSDAKAIRSFQKRIEEHQAKLEAYKRDPYAFDNQGRLKNASNEELRRKIIEGRIRKLEGEIRKFRRNIAKILERYKGK